MNTADSNKTKNERVPLLLREVSYGAYGSPAAPEGSEPAVQEVGGCGNLVKNPTPLPLKQLLVVFFMRLAEPIAYTQIFPYINVMMEDIGAVDDPLKAGYYSGATESVFAIAELLTVMRWGSLSDRVGRKPIILMGFVGAMLSTLLFGFSKSFTWTIITRFLAGALSGNIAVLLSAVGDITDETNQTRAFAFFGVANNIAQIAGPSIGGTFANPAVTFPESFGKLKVFQSFPFLLPCLISALITLIAMLYGAVSFKETLKRASSESPVDASEKTSTWRVARAPLLQSILMPFFLLSVLNTSFLVLFSLFAYTPVQSGGLSRDPEEIGLVIAYSGLAGAIIQVLVLPELLSRYGSLSLYKFFMSSWPLVYLLFPILNALAQRTNHGLNGTIYVNENGYSTQPAGLAVWFGIGLLLTLSRLASMAFSLNLVLTRNASPSAEVLGTVFALSHLVNCSGRSLAPAFVSSLFAFSKDYGIAGGDLYWMVMTAISILGVWLTFRARDGSLEKRS